MSFILGVLVGLIVGWNFLPQPAVIAEKFAKLRGKTTTTDTVVPPVVSTTYHPPVDAYTPTTTTYTDPTKGL